MRTTIRFTSTPSVGCRNHSTSGRGACFPEPGVNLDLYRTLEAVYRDREHVTMWGPFRIHQVVYERSLGVEQILDSGVAEYRAISTPRNLLISDCIHAVAAIDPIFGRDHYPLIRIGKPASRHIARQVMTRSVFDQWQGDNSWLIRAWAWTAIRSSSSYRSRSPNGIASSAVARTEAKLDQPSPGHGMGRGRGQLTLATCLVQPSVDHYQTVRPRAGR